MKGSSSSSSNKKTQGKGKKKKSKKNTTRFADPPTREEDAVDSSENNNSSSNNNSNIQQDEEEDVDVLSDGNKNNGADERQIRQQQEEAPSPDDHDGYDAGTSEEEATFMFPSRQEERKRSSRIDHEMRRADRLSVRLLAISDDDEDEEDRILRKSLRLDSAPSVDYEEEDEEEEEEEEDDVKLAPGTAALKNRLISSSSSSSSSPASASSSSRRRQFLGRPGQELRTSSGSILSLTGDKKKKKDLPTPSGRAEWGLCTMITMATVAIALVSVACYVGVEFVGPPSIPVGPYRLLERQEGDDFFKYYTFYEGPDSVGSNGYNNYVGMKRAGVLGIVNVTYEIDEMNGVYQDARRRRRRNLRSARSTEATGPGNISAVENDLQQQQQQQKQQISATVKEPFVYLKSSPTNAGPRESIRLEGMRRFNRGLFIIDVRHIPVGCGVWPAFWMTDEANWPVNGEIDILEGVNYQSQAKTALHSTKGCSMEDIPYNTMTGSWDTAQGIPDAKTGIPDMTLRYARDCFVYSRHQWLNQGCVAVNDQNGTLGFPLNDRGGGVFVLEWDPANRHIRTYVFTPHTTVPRNLVQAIETASAPDPADRVMPDPDQWPTPYGYFGVGEGTGCPSSHFKRMRLVFNTAFCGSVAGNRYQMDCPVQAKQFATCNEYIASRPHELDDAYWKIRGVYVYEREWEKKWLA